MLNRGNPTPLYYQLAEAIRFKIESGEYSIGQCIPPEPELCTLYKVSRITVRKAIDQLVDQGLLVRQPGRGTFVRATKVTQALNVISSWTETMLSRGMHVETADLQIRETLPPERVAEALRLQPGETVVEVRRLRLANGEPVTIMTNYLITSVGRRLMEVGMTSESLYEVLEEKLGVVPETAEEVVQAVAANAEQARLLKTKRGFPLIQVTRVTYDGAGIPFEYVTVVSRADRYQYSVHLSGRGK